MSERSELAGEHGALPGAGGDEAHPCSPGDAGLGGRGGEHR